MFVLSVSFICNFESSLINHTYCRIRPRTHNVQLMDFTVEAFRRNAIAAPNADRIKLLNLEIRNTGMFPFYF